MYGDPPKATPPSSPSHLFRVSANTSAYADAAFRNTDARMYVFSASMTVSAESTVAEI